MDKVTRTDQLGRLIELSGNAIALTRDEKRDPTALISVLQAFKEDKHDCAFKQYPHYDETRRPDFGFTQIRYLCELTPGMRVRDHCLRDPIGNPMVVVSHPYRYSKHGTDGWWIKVACSEGLVVVERENSLADRSIVPYYLGGWNQSNYLSYDEPAPRFQYHHCYHHHRS